MFNLNVYVPFFNIGSCECFFVFGKVTPNVDETFETIANFWRIHSFTFILLTHEEAHAVM